MHNLTYVYMYFKRNIMLSHIPIYYNNEYTLIYLHCFY